MSLSFLLPPARPSCLLIYTILFRLLLLFQVLPFTQPLLIRSIFSYFAAILPSLLSLILHLFPPHFLSFLPSFRWSFIPSACALCILSILNPFPSISLSFFPFFCFVSCCPCLLLFFCFPFSSFNVSWHVETMKCRPCQAHPPPAVCFCIQKPKPRAS